MNKSKDRFSEISKIFYDMDKTISIKVHNEMFNNLSNIFDTTEVDELLSDDEKKEKQIDTLTKMNIEASFVMLGRIKKAKNVRNFSIACTIPMLILVGYSIHSNNFYNIIIFGIGFIVDLLQYNKITDSIEKLKNEFLEHNKDFFLN